jgi:hypothetical protein
MRHSINIQPKKPNTSNTVGETKRAMHFQIASDVRNFSRLSLASTKLLHVCNHHACIARTIVALKEVTNAASISHGWTARNVNYIPVLECSQIKCS